MDRAGMVTMTAPRLRPYQIKAVADVRAAYEDNARRVLFQLPTGGGKTIIFSHVLAGAAQRGRRVLVLTHRQEIADQVEAAVAMADVGYGKIAAGCAESDEAVQIASIATLAQPKPLARWRDWADFVVIDECHHSVSPTWARAISAQPRARILGVTATPERLDGRGLSEQFDRMVTGPSTADLIRDEWLSPFVVFEPTSAPDMSAALIRAGDYAAEDVRAAMGGVVIQSAVDECERICPSVPTLAFCATIDHSQEVAERFRQHGVRAEHIDGETAASDRRKAIAGLADGSLDVITNVNLFSEGVDVPALGAVLMLRPTASLALYLQMVGRALRPVPGEVAKILDFSGNCSRHGLPDEPRKWSLYSKPRRPRERAEGPRLRRCSACSALNRAGAHSCANCGADLRTPKERHEIERTLRLAQQREGEDLVRSLMYRDRLAWAGGDKQRLQLVERVCGYKSGWAWHRLRELAEKRGERAHG
jgi:DNA repair protein RadD